MDSKESNTNPSTSLPPAYSPAIDTEVVLQPFAAEAVERLKQPDMNVMITRKSLGGEQASKSSLYPKIFFAGSSRCDKTSNIVVPFNITGATMVSCGEDTITYNYLSDDIFIGQIHDGHGLDGKIASQTFASEGLLQFIDIMPQLQEAIAEKDLVRIKELVTNVFENKEKKYTRHVGGSTASCVVLVRIDNSWYCVVGSVGDSPVICDTESDILEIGGLDSCENPEAYGRYIEHQKKVIRESMMEEYTEEELLEAYRKHVRPVVYARINCVSIGRVTKKPGPKCDYLPIEVYERDENGIPTNIVNKINAAYMAKLQVGGSQSRGGKRISFDGKTVPEPYQHLNWGSTILRTDQYGGTQMLSSLGDKYEKNDTGILWKPSVSVVEWGTSPGLIILMSDGFDIFTPVEVYDIARRAWKEKHSNPAEAVYDEIRKFVQVKVENGGPGMQYRFLQDKPVWDDLSIMVIAFDETP